MKAAAAFPELRQICGAYLNAGFSDAYGSVAGALRAYRRETGAVHRASALAELERLVAEAPDLASALGELGCGVYLAGPRQARVLAETLRSALL